MIDGYSPRINGEVTSKNKGVNAVIGTTTDKSECLRAVIYIRVVIAFKVPPIMRAGQNKSPN